MEVFCIGLFGPPSYRQSSRYYSVVLYLEAVCVRGYSCTAVKLSWKPGDSWKIRNQRVLHSRRALVQAG